MTAICRRLCKAHPDCICGRQQAQAAAALASAEQIEALTRQVLELQTRVLELEQGLRLARKPISRPEKPLQDGADAAAGSL